jgi:adenosylcobinamide kinase/adenosylcobinamide-phosphate guanylyltransferase
MFILVTGVSGSGKSEYAENLAVRLAGGDKKIYIATMQPYGKDGEERIKRHHTLRAGKGFTTVERYTDIGKVDLCENKTVLLECMSNLLANEMYGLAGEEKQTVNFDCTKKITQDCLKLYSKCKNLIIVTNEVFSDGCAYDEPTRQYIDNLGKINTELAAKADVVVEVIYSVPYFWKGGNLCT